MNTKKARSSNIELLRIIAMLMIVSYHIVNHCVNDQLQEADSIERMANGFFSKPSYNPQLLLLDAVMPFGAAGNAIFILISGFFMSSKGKNINLAKTSGKLLQQLGFAAVTLVAASTVLCRLTRHLKGVFLEWQTINIFNNMSWFIGYYFLIIVIAALFLNDILSKLSEKQYIAFLAATFALTQFGWSGKLIESFADGMRTLCIGIFLYALGGFIKQYNPFCRVRTFIFPLIIIAVYAFVLASGYNDAKLSISEFLRNKPDDYVLPNITWYDNHSIVSIIMGISLFEWARRIHLPSSRVINFLGKATFMVYLIHDNTLFYSIWGLHDWVRVLYYQPKRFVGELLLYTLATFFIGVLLYAIYLLVVRIARSLSGLALKPKAPCKTGTTD